MDKLLHPVFWLDVVTYPHAQNSTAVWLDCGCRYGMDDWLHLNENNGRDYLFMPNFQLICVSKRAPQAAADHGELTICVASISNYWKYCSQVGTACDLAHVII